MNSTETSTTSSDKTLEAMRQFSQTYAQRTGTYFCTEPSVTAVVIEGLAKNKEELGSPLCPCRHYEDKEAEVKNTFWNCPCCLLELPLCAHAGAQRVPLYAIFNTG